MVYDQETIKEIAQKYRIDLILLFGSRAGDGFKPDSDLDVGVLFAAETASGHGERMGLIVDLMRVFPDYTIDLAILNHGDPLFQFEVITNYQIIYEAEPECFINFYIRAVKQYQDIQKFLKQEQVYLRNFIGGVRTGTLQCHPPQIN